MSVYASKCLRFIMVLSEEMSQHRLRPAFKLGWTSQQNTFQHRNANTKFNYLFRSLFANNVLSQPMGRSWCASLLTCSGTHTSVWTWNKLWWEALPFLVGRWGGGYDLCTCACVCACVTVVRTYSYECGDTSSIPRHGRWGGWTSIMGRLNRMGGLLALLPPCAQCWN